MREELFVKSSRREQEVKWAAIWFKMLCKFHQRDVDRGWEFGRDDVIVFCRSKLEEGVPAWKRLRIIEGLILYAREVQQRSADPLIGIRNQMQVFAANERAGQDRSPTIEEAVGKIDPSEPDAIAAFRREMRVHGLALRTERSYVGKLKSFMAERGLVCLADFDRITAVDVEAHLTDLAVDGNVAASTQNAAFHALLKFFTLVLKREMGRIEAIRASKGKQIPTVMSTGEVSRVLDGLNGQPLVIAQLLYGCGMRISEAIRLRIKDIDFENRLIQIHQSKGGKSRLVPLPERLIEPLKRFVGSRRAMHEHDVADGTASVWLPFALAKKYPSAHADFRWQYLFASTRLSKDPRTGHWHRHHIHSETFPKHLRRAVDGASIVKHVSSHTFRHCFATHLLWSGTDIRTIQQLLGHSDVKTTMIYTHVVNHNGLRLQSPLDRLEEGRSNVEEERAGYRILA